GLGRDELRHTPAVGSVTLAARSSSVGAPPGARGVALRRAYRDAPRLRERTNRRRGRPLAGSSLVVGGGGGRLPVASPFPAGPTTRAGFFGGQRERRPG